MLHEQGINEASGCMFASMGIYMTTIISSQGDVGHRFACVGGDIRCIIKIHTVLIDATNARQACVDELIVCRGGNALMNGSGPSDCLCREISSRRSDAQALKSERTIAFEVNCLQPP